MKGPFRTIGIGRAQNSLGRHLELRLISLAVGGAAGVDKLAADKVIGSLLLAERLPAQDLILVMSSRASFELVQKAVMAGFPALVAVSAASSLAVDLAREAGMALTGFTRGERFNLYSGALKAVPEVAAGS